MAGKKLNEVWESNRELFGNEEGEHFPLLVKILDANRDLSVQVHPDDSFAREIEGEAYGKTECWYIIDCDPGSELIFGHHAESKESFEQMVAVGNGAVCCVVYQSSQVNSILFQVGRSMRSGQER